MAATKRDVSGVFGPELRGASRQAAVLDQTFRLNHHGLTFATDARLPEWTEVSVKVQLPQPGPRRSPFITCRAVVVECTHRQQGGGYNVSLLFLDLPKSAQAQLDLLPPAMHSPLSVSIAR
jgi:hypothetical protein